MPSAAPYRPNQYGKAYDEAELEAYRRYLNEPWPLPKPGVRPTIPKAIRDDVKEESHHGCAICGHMDNGLIAHIECRVCSLTPISIEHLEITQECAECGRLGFRARHHGSDRFRPVAVDARFAAWS